MLAAVAVGNGYRLVEADKGHHARHHSSRGRQDMRTEEGIEDQNGSSCAHLGPGTAKEVNKGQEDHDPCGKAQADGEISQVRLGYEVGDQASNARGQAGECGERYGVKDVRRQAWEKVPPGNILAYCLFSSRACS